MATQKDFFDIRAGDWEETCYPPPVRRRLEQLIEAFGIQAGERLLDIGTGPGVLIPYLRIMVGETGQVFAFDLSFEMVRLARKKPLAPRDLVIQADAESIPFDSDAFDRVICFAAFPHFAAPESAVAEMGRVLRPEGELVIAHLMSRKELAAHHGTHHAVEKDLLPEDPVMERMFQRAGLALAAITNRPGRYLARGAKIG